MNKYLYQFLSDAELETVQLVNKELIDSGLVLPKCKCAIHDTLKPDFCKEGPTIETRMPECGYYFEVEGNSLVRKGACKNCGRCCQMPRHNGDPYGFYDPTPTGKPCKHLIVEDK